MKKILLATTALVLSAGVAAADVALSGDARMGIGYNNSNLGPNQSKLFFTSRVRVQFTLSGETDTGLSFGASFRAHDAANANGGTAGSVFVRGAFGTITMGDTNGAAEEVVRDIAGVGLTGLGDHNETQFLSNPGNNGTQATHQRPTARYQYTFDAFTVAVSFSNPGRNSVAVAAAAPAPAAVTTGQIAAIGVRYNANGIDIGLGYETASRFAGPNRLNHLVLGANYTIDGFTVGARYGVVSGSAATGLTSSQKTSYRIGASYNMAPFTVSAYYAKNFGAGANNGAKSVGVGAIYDLGGGASLRGGIVRTEVDTLTGVGGAAANGVNSFNGTTRRTIADFGLNFTF